MPLSQASGMRFRPVWRTGPVWRAGPGRRCRAGPPAGVVSPFGHFRALMALNRHFPGHSVLFVHGFSAISRPHRGWSHSRKIRCAWSALDAVGIFLVSGGGLSPGGNPWPAEQAVGRAGPAPAFCAGTGRLKSTALPRAGSNIAQSSDYAGRRPAGARNNRFGPEMATAGAGASVHCHDSGVNVRGGATGPFGMKGQEWLRTGAWAYLESCGGPGRRAGGWTRMSWWLVPGTTA
jgi:hypothetical protein